MKHHLDDVLDNCLAELLAGGVSVEECLSRHPEDANSLRPLLEMALQARGLELPEMGSAASGAAKRRMMAALDEKQLHELRFPLSLRGFVARVGSSLSGPGRGEAPLRGTLLVTAAMALALVLLTILPGALFEVGRYDLVARTAVLADVAGVVEVQESAGGDWRPASAGIALNSGYHVRTGSLSSVSLMFFDGSRTVLSSGTEVSLTEVSSRRDGASRTVILNQLVGQTENRVARMVDTSSRFEVRTPTLVAVVHGTEFSVNVAQDGTTSVSVREGTVGVTIDGTTEVVGAGQFASVPPPSTTPESSPTATWVSIEAADALDKSELAGIARPTGTPDAGSGPDQTAASTATTSSTTSAPEPTPTSDEVADDSDDPLDKDHPAQPTHPGLPDQAEPDVPPGRDPDRDKGKDKNQ